MDDQSDIDKKYFVDKDTYNCPFCNRKNVVYQIIDTFHFDWTSNKKCYGVITQCSHCENKSIHLSYEDITTYLNGRLKFDLEIEDIDSKLFYSVPTSFFVLDNRINSTIRELITEAEGCLNMNFLTGASACMRKAIYELLVLEKIEGEHYEERIKTLKSKYSTVDPDLFDILASIQDMTSDKIHEQSWDKWDSGHLKFIIETLKSVLYDIYVIPADKLKRSLHIKKLREDFLKSKNPTTVQGTRKTEKTNEGKT